MIKEELQKTQEKKEESFLEKLLAKTRSHSLAVSMVAFFLIMFSISLLFQEYTLANYTGLSVADENSPYNFLNCVNSYKTNHVGPIECAPDYCKYFIETSQTKKAQDLSLYKECLFSVD